MEVTEGMITSLTNSSEDSGIDNGFLSDSSTSSASRDCPRQTCVFSDLKRTNNRLKDSCRKCVLNSYDISGRCIESISPRTFQYFSNCLRKLNLSNNNIKSLPVTLTELKNLEELNLSINELTNIPESWKVLHKLKVLNLSHNSLYEIPQCLELGMERLTTIDLSHNHIKKFDDPPFCLPLLMCLNLCNNQFISFPLWLFSEQCRSLKKLDMSFNYCFDTPSLHSKLLVLKHHRTSALKSVQYLNVSNTGTKFETVINYLPQFESLQCLHIGNTTNINITYNHFWEVSPKLFFNPSSVTELHVPKVALAGLPEDIWKLKNLKVFDVSHNPLTWLPECFGKLAFLEELIMTNCSMVYLPETFNQLTRLRKLILNNNVFTDVRRELSGLSCLQWLDLYDNKLETFPLSRAHLLTLHMLDVAENCFDSIEVLQELQGVDGENLLEIYNQLQARLRDKVNCSFSRSNGYKEICLSNSWQSSESLHTKLYWSDDETMSHCENQEGLGFTVEEEENWDDESTSNDYFDPNLVERYYLAPGRFKFGWTPPKRHRRCTIPVALRLKGFIYVPGDSHQTSRKRRVKIDSLPVVEGQFDDINVNDTAAVQEQETLTDSLKKIFMFVRNPQGPTVQKCVICSPYEDCWHKHVWIAF